jgi:UDP-2-acetamido-2-deoxy-ribo-hexuluronate aminotransferase
LSDFGCTSFFPSKPLGCYGDGGALFTNDDVLAEKARVILAHGSKQRYVHTVIGINGRLDAIQAAILNVKLKYFPQEVDKRIEIGKKYIDLLSNKDVRLPVIKADRTSVYAQFTLQASNRSEIINKLQQNGVPTAIHYPTPLHLQKCFDYLNYSLGDFPVAEKAANEVFSLPMSPFLTDDQIRKISDLI